MNQPTQANPDLVSRFLEEATAAGAAVHGPCSASAALEIVRTIVRGTASAEVLSWTPDQLGVPDAWLGLSRMGIAARCAELPNTKDDRLKVLADIGRAEVGLTGVVGALADTGTLVLASGRGRPRLTWLLPAHHVALVPASLVAADMASFFARPGGVSPADLAHVAFVTGPSRTADIELTLTRGVHGPKNVHVIVLDA